MKIYLNDMVFYGYHGVHPEEQVLGQRFIVNITVETDPETDDTIESLEQTVDYTLIYAEVKHLMENQVFQLLESCANSILDRLLENFPEIVSAAVNIKKPSVPIRGSLAGVAVEMKRTRKCRS
ncbi:MAG: dihydroneopterin aldolase [Candidatus Cloacimonadota bacterium]|nr:MAG: dihydroneopterin aldolase [Candidatus Cloacimonadota bacterium]